jgi:hypothetical protein
MKTFLQTHKAITFRMDHAANGEEYLALHELRKAVEAREIARRNGLVETFKALPNG